MCRRKQLNSLDVLSLKTLPYYAWECITLNMQENFHLELAIQNQKAMDQFLLYLIKELNTVDGKRGSAEATKDEMVKVRSRKSTKTKT